VGWGAVALGLVAVVAMAAHGAVWSTGHDASPRSLPHAVVVAGLITAGVLGVILILAALATQRAHETAEQRRRRWTTAIGFLIAIALIAIIRLSFGGLHARNSANPSRHALGTGATATASQSGHATPDTWWPVVFVALGATALFVTANARRRRPVPAAPEPVDDTVALIDASLDDLRREPDARRAVVAAYARMERRLAVRGFARQQSETPTEYLHRALAGERPVGVEPLRELTALAELARFSTAPIDETMRGRAIAALEHLRDELRTADAPVDVDADATV
jgi:hypothetical protein